MAPGPVDVLSERWYDERQARQLSTDSYHPMRHSLEKFLPADAIAGIAFRDDEPFVLALAEGALLLFTPPESDRLLDARALPLGQITALAATCVIESTVRSNFRKCTWTLRAAGDNEAIETRRSVGQSFDPDNGGEAVMLALAERLGWRTPLWQETKEAA